MKRRSLAVLGAAAVVAMATLVLGSGVAGASSRVLYVSTAGSNGGNSCQTKAQPCKTIDFALSVAPSGGTIKVEAGTYAEQVTITKPVTILGAGDAQTIIKPTTVPLSDTDTDTAQPQFYVVDVKNTSGVTIQGVGVDGSAATSYFDSDGYACGQDFVGIYFHDASGTVESTAVTGIELPPDLFGCQGGQGIYVASDSTSATPSHVTMTSVAVTKYDKNGITCDDPGTVCSITKSQVTGLGSTPLIAQNGIQIWASAATLSGNTVTGDTYDGPSYAASGILIGNPSTLSVTGNKVSSSDSGIYLIQDQSPAWVYCGNTGTSCTNPAAHGTTFTLSKNTVANGTNAYGNPIASGYGDGIDLDSVGTSSLVQSNTASSDPGSGISLYGTTGVTVSKNTLSAGDGNGIYVGSGTASSSAGANSVIGNKITNAQVDGILADTPSTGNEFQTNKISGSGTYDAQDNSSGSGAEGTADGWSNNTCTTSSPAGLCYTAPRRVVNHAEARTAAPALHVSLVRRSR
jgi:parallel beta-helix repeat protein